MVFGATVDLEDEDSGEAVTYQIVGDLEADIKKQPDRGVLADRACADRQERGRQLRVHRAEWRQALRDHRRPLRVIG